MQNQLQQMPVQPPKMPASSSRILYDMPCKVCRDHSSGKHYGIFACDGCAGFFKRSIRRNRQYVCKAKSEGGCIMDKTHRNQCRACRLAKCIQAGMNKDAVQHERGPRNSTIRRQMALYFKEPEMMANVVAPPPAALDLALPKTPSETRVSIPLSPPSQSLLSHAIYSNALTMTKHLPINVPLTSPLMVVDSICEQAARLLFFNVDWATELIATSNLIMEDQLTLLESSWRDIFLLTAAQMLPSLNPTPLVPPGPQGVTLTIEVTKFCEILTGFSAMNLDHHEFSCYRALVLFQAGLDYGERSNGGSGSSSLSPRIQFRDASSVEKLRELRDRAHIALGQRLNMNSMSTGTLRFGRLLFMLPMLRSVSAQAIQELFFKRTIGEIPIERIIRDMYVQQQREKNRS
ncbi:nuclear receptor subfamily 2 group E member 1 [Pseudomyrmex gracilis]|uniref:nuclear receptor subfamily 2 group E member 1 n=1 Tax=Pseudomyrmex gracilis TaxID=219809 RepID=UPI0009949338|nr:nuclear receptor subfamily 2 group E member 1 [Pseudomyrmex gracilis]